VQWREAHIQRADTPADEKPQGPHRHFFGAFENDAKRADGKQLFACSDDDGWEKAHKQPLGASENDAKWADDMQLFACSDDDGWEKAHKQPLGASENGAAREEGSSG
jgi:hypothetical protein